MGLGESLEETQRKKDFSRVERDCLQARDRETVCVWGGYPQDQKDAGRLDVSMVTRVN